VDPIIRIDRDYGCLELDPAERVAFVAQAERCLSELGRQMKAAGEIVDSRVTHTHAPTANYAGRVVGTFTGLGRQRSVSVIFAHHPEEVLTRGDGVAAYALHRRHLSPAEGGALIDPAIRPEDRVPLKGLYLEALRAQVVRMLQAESPPSRGEEHSSQ
jgi:hypothetical protein